jgi:hypothetical protein
MDAKYSEALVPYIFWVDFSIVKMESSRSCETLVCIWHVDPLLGNDYENQLENGP